MLTSEQFDRTRRLALQLAGLDLHERHRESLDRKIRRFGIHDPAGVDALLNAADDGDPAAVRRLIGLLRTSFTGFFRHPWHFAVAAEHALWAVHRCGEARLWSAAASTGEEPYSLAMTLINMFGRDDPAATILATDIDEDALVIARRGEYRRTGPRRAGAGAANAILWRICGDKALAHRPGATPSRGIPRFEPDRFGLAGPGPFDVVFCRNVLMYLEACHRYAVLERMASVLEPDGVLMLDPAEHLGKAEHLFALQPSGVYSRRPKPRARRDLIGVSWRPG